MQPADDRGRLHRVAQGGAVKCLETARLVEHLDDVGHEDVIVRRRITGTRRGVPRHGVGESTGGSAGLGAAAAASPGLEPVVQPPHRRVGLDVEDRVHHVGMVDHAEHRDRLVRRHDQLEPRPLRRDQPRPCGGVAEPARSEHRLVCLCGHLARQAEPGRPRSHPAQRRLTAGSVVVQRRAGMIIRAADHRRLVVSDLIGAHGAEPRHRSAPLDSPVQSPGTSRSPGSHRLQPCSPSQRFSRSPPGLGNGLWMAGQWRSTLDRWPDRGESASFLPITVYFKRDEHTNERACLIAPEQRWWNNPAGDTGTPSEIGLPPCA